MFKKVLQSLAVLTICTFSYSQNIDVLHYRYQLELNDKNDSIKGNAFIKFLVTGSASEFSFDLATVNSYNKGMKVTHVSATGLITFNHHANTLKISYPTSFNKGDTAEINIQYAGIPADGLIISKNKFGNRTFFADNWPDRARHWIPCVDDPSDKASVEFIVTAPVLYQVISNGVLQEEKKVAAGKKMTHWKEEVPLPTKVMVIGVAAFAIDTVGIVNDIPVYSYVYPQNREKGFYDYAQAKDILSFFIGYIGPYPYKKLASVQSTTRFGGMENASAIFYHEHSVTGQRSEESLLAHEIAHQWFGNMVTEKSFAHLWLSEGFATYMTHIYMESKYGTGTLKKRMEEDRDAIIEFGNNNKKAVVDSISQPMSLLNANSYQKGSWVLHMLRHELGDTVFREVIRTYYQTYKGSNADTKDFRLLAEKISGKNLETFFRQWLFTPGLPRLNIAWKYDEKTKQLILTSTQKQAEVFTFNLDLLIQTATGNAETIRMSITGKQMTQVFPVQEKPLSILADPSCKMLFAADIYELK
jgi:aminopeptidase N